MTLAAAVFRFAVLFHQCKGAFLHPMTFRISQPFAKFMRAALAVAVIAFAQSVYAAALDSGRMLSAASDGGALVLAYENARVKVNFFRGGVVRVELSAEGFDSAFPSLLTVENGLTPEAFRPNPVKQRAETDTVAVEYARASFGLRIAGPGDVTLLKIPEGGVSWEPDGSYTVKFEELIGDKYLGMGEPMPEQLVEVVKMDHNGRVRPIWNRHEPPSDLGIPFFFNPRGYGLFFDNPWRAALDFSPKHTFSYRAEGGPLRFYLFYGPDANSVLERYTALTGRPPMPPRWAAGYMQSQYGYVNEADFRGLMENFRSRRIPADTLIFDLDWFGDRFLMGDLWWGANNFPDGPAFMRELDEKGFKAITIVEPYVFENSRNHKFLKDNKMFTLDAAGNQNIFPFWSEKPAGLMDFTNPDTRKWFADQIARIKDSGVDAWWTDLNEPETDPENNAYQAGPRAAWHNMQAFLMNKAIYDLYSEKYPGDRPFIMSRSGFAGIQRFGTSVWSGDVNATFHHLENQIPVALSAGLSGLPMWNSDIGGFHGKPGAELFVRWIQFGAFCPVMRPHGNHDPREPWAFGEQSEAIIKKYIELRYRLIPYLYTLYRQMHETGAPVMRPMFMEFPGDANSVKMESQFMYGPWLLVAPVTDASAKKKRVCLPKGNWIYFWDDRIAPGAQGITAPVDLETMPLFVREGALLPMAPVMQFHDESPLDLLEIHYYPSGEPTQFTLYEDDGVSTAYLKGEYAQTVLRGYRTADSVTVIAQAPRGSYKGMPAERSFRFVIHMARPPRLVALDGNRADAASWFYDAEKQIVTVNTPPVKSGKGVQADILF